MVTFMDQNRATYGVEPICRVVPIAPSTYFRWKAAQADPTKRSTRAVRDEVLKAIIQRIWRENDQAYGSQKVWKQMGREGLREARCRVRRLMRDLGLVGVVRGRAWTTTTQADATAARPGRPGRSALRRDAAESALGVGFHVRRYVARFRVRGLRDRRLRTTHRRLARVVVAAHRFRARCA
jgi:hypothetical protein